MKWDKILSTIIAGVGACANYFFGGWDMALKTLALFMILDYLTGLICAGKDKMISSSTGFKGIGKKILILIIVGVAVSIDNVTGANGMVRSMIIFFYASMEGISILENAARAGVPVPEQLKNMLIQLKEGNKKAIKEQEE